MQARIVVSSSPTKINVNCFCIEYFILIAKKVDKVLDLFILLYIKTLLVYARKTRNSYIPLHLFFYVVSVKEVLPESKE